MVSAVSAGPRPDALMIEPTDLANMRACRKKRHDILNRRSL
jgi:hypothetical protein